MIKHPWQFDHRYSIPIRLTSYSVCVRSEHSNLKFSILLERSTSTYNIHNIWRLKPDISASQYGNGKKLAKKEKKKKYFCVRFRTFRLYFVSSSSSSTFSSSFLVYVWNAPFFSHSRRVLVVGISQIFIYKLFLSFSRSCTDGTRHSVILWLWRARLEIVILFSSLFIYHHHNLMHAHGIASNCCWIVKSMLDNCVVCESVYRLCWCRVHFVLFFRVFYL